MTSFQFVVLGGLAIGMGMNGMGAVEALEVYGLLTIGDGLVSQIPALLISTAAGLVVTRVSSEDEDSSLGSDIATQIFGNTKALGIAAIFLLALALVPGLPALPFLVLAVVFFVTSRRLTRRRATDEATREAEMAREEAARETRAREAMVPLVVPVSVELAPDLAERVLDDDVRRGCARARMPSVRILADGGETHARASRPISRSASRARRRAPRARPAGSPSCRDPRWQP